MKRLFWLLLLTGLLASHLVAQINKYGVPFIRNFDPQEMHATENNWSAVLDHRGILYVANNDAGVLEFDGKEWRSIPLSNLSAVRSLYCAHDGTIFVGGEGDFGYLAPDARGIMKFVSFLPKLDTLGQYVDKVYEVFEEGDKIYFCEPNNWHTYDLKTHQIKSYNLKKMGFDYGKLGFDVNHRMYFQDMREGLLEFRNDTFIVAPGGSFFEQKNLLSIIPFSGEQVLVGTFMHGFYLYDQHTGMVAANALKHEANDFLKANRFYCMSALPDNKLAMGTLDEGVMVADNSGNPIELWNKKTGLRDQTITRLYYDTANVEAGQLWAVLYNGLASVEYFSPFRVMGDNFGLQGTINDIAEYNHVMYVATSSGVFYQSTDDIGNNYFRKIEDIEFQVWSLLRFKSRKTGTKVLWAGSEGGIYEIGTNNRVNRIEEHIKGLDNPGMRFYTFTLFAENEEPSHIYVGTNNSVVEIYYADGSWHQGFSMDGVNDEVRSIALDVSGDLWAATTLRGIVRFNLNDTGNIALKRYTVEDGLPSVNTNFVYNIDGELFAATIKGLYRFKEDENKFVPDQRFNGGDKTNQNGIFRIVPTSNGDFWLSRTNENGTYWVELQKKQRERFVTENLPFKRLPNKSADAIFVPESGPVWIGLSDKIYTYNPAFQTSYRDTFPVLIREVRLGEDSVIFGGAFTINSESGRRSVLLTQPADNQPIIKFRDNTMTFNWAAPYFEATDALQYSFRMNGFDHSWSKWSERNEFTYTNLPHGKLVFEVKAKNVYDIESNPATYSFTILPPWYQTFWAYLLYVVLAFVLVLVILKLYTRRLQNEKIRLEGIVARRTAEVVRQKEELEDSITYASRIQRAILPSEKVLNENLVEHFIFFKPRDIVSGDFYWMTTRHDKIIVVAADCTGHGVPGAFMSLLGMSYLNEIVNKSDVMKSDEVLGLLREEIMTSLKQTGKEGEAKDGMDLALCIIDKAKKKVQFSGAYNPLFMVRPLTKEEKSGLKRGIQQDFPPRSLYNDTHVLIQITGDKMPIGITAKVMAPFKYNEIDVGKDYSFYVFSDGYVDQFGGPDGKKFMVRSFKKMILEIQDQSMEQQGKTIEKRFVEWKGNLPQVDDILVIGFKID